MDGTEQLSWFLLHAYYLIHTTFYRTFAGFQALVEKDWLAFGHPFSDRVGMPNISGSGNFDFPRQSSSAGSFPSSPVRQSSGSAASQSSNSSHGHDNYLPIFIQWIDCVSQLMRMYPCAFEFSPIVSGWTIEVWEMRLEEHIEGMCEDKEP